MSGAGNRTLKELGRWKKAEMIDRYAHLSQEHLAQALARIGSSEPHLAYGITRTGNRRILGDG